MPVPPDGGFGEASPAPERSPLSPASFPRIATYFLATHVAPEQEEVMAKSDLVVVDAEAAALDRAPLDRLRAKDSARSLLAYLRAEEIPHVIDPVQRPLASARFSQITPAQWMVDPGSALVAAVGADATRLRVANPAAFAVTRPRSDFYGPDEPTYLLVEGEHMRLLGVEGDELVVERGYRSTAAPHASGARVASHVVLSAGAWMLDLAANAPVEPGNGTWRDVVVDEAASLVAKGPWNGVFLAACFEDIAFLNGGVLDLDRDGAADDPKEASKQWSLGMGMLVDALRARLGSTAPILANPGAHDCPHASLDGILLEGWPLGHAPDHVAFETGLERYLSWTKQGRGLTIANAFSPKVLGAIDAGADEQGRTDSAAMRFGLGVTLLGDGHYTFDNGVLGHDVTWSYDEYDGAGLGRGWLGRPKGERESQGAIVTREFERGLVVVNTGTVAAEATVPAGYVKLAGKQDPVHNDGAPVTGTLKVAAKDAYLLRRVP